MKKIALLLAGLLLCSATLLAQRPARETFTGRVSCAMGSESSAPVTFTVDNTTGDFTFSSKGNGGRVGAFTWKGKMPSVKSQNLAASGAVWTFQLTEWSDFTVGTREKDSATGKMVDKTSRLKHVQRTSATTAPGMGTSDGKSITLNIRIPYEIDSQNGAVPVTFTVTLDVSNGYKGAISSAPSGGGNTVQMPTGTNEPVHINYENGISIGSAGNSPTQTVRASVGGITFELAPGYSAKACDNIGGGESIKITRNNSSDFLYVEAQRQGLSNLRNLSSDQVGDLLATRVQFINTVMPGVRMDGDPKIYFDDNSDGYYYQHAYSYGSGKDSQGRSVKTYAEATKAGASLITAGFAVARDQGELNALSEIYCDIVNAAANK